MYKCLILSFRRAKWKKVNSIILFLFIHRCLDTDERNRSTVQYLLDHPFIKPTINSSPHDSVSTVNNETKQVNHSLEEDSDNIIFLPQASYDLSLGHSRLHQEFDFQEFLGKGGFGNVIKVSDIISSSSSSLFSNKIIVILCIKV